MLWIEKVPNVGISDIVCQSWVYSGWSVFLLRIGVFGLRLEWGFIGTKRKVGGAEVLGFFLGVFAALYRECNISGFSERG